MISRTFSDISGHFGRWAGLGRVGRWAGGSGWRGARVVEGCTFMLGGGNRGWQGAGVIKPGAGNHKGCPYGLGGGGWGRAVVIKPGAGMFRLGGDTTGRPRGATTRVAPTGWVVGDLGGGGRPHPSPPPEGEGILWFVPGWGVGVGRGCCHQTGGGGVVWAGIPRGGQGRGGRPRGDTGGGNHKGCPYGLGGGGIWGGDAPTLALPRRGRGFCGLLRVGGWGWGGA